MRQDLPAWRYNHLAWCPVGQAGEAGKGAVSGLSALTKKLPRQGGSGRELALRTEMDVAERKPQRQAKISASNAANLGWRGCKLFSV